MSQQGQYKRQCTQPPCDENKPTSLLDLDDDLLGEVYTRLDSPQSKQAFRHAHSVLYKSRAINAQIRPCTLDGITTPAKALACFPPFATLKEVRFYGRASTLQNDHLLNDILGEAVRLKTNRLSAVETIKLKMWHKLDEFTAAALLVLFPKLSTGPTATLDLEDSDVAPPFFEALGSHARGLERLHVAHCTGVHSALPILASAVLPLRYLEVEDPVEDDDSDAHFCAASLSGLKTLQELVMCDVIMDGSLGDLLPQLDHLHTLVLRYTSTPPGTPVASRSLKRLVLDSSLPQLCRSNFPALQLLEVHSLHFNDLVPEAEADVDDEEAMAVAVVRRLESLSAVLSEFPLKMGDSQGAFRFLLFSPAIRLSTRMLEMVAPLKPHFCHDVRALAVEGMLVDAGSLFALSDLCKNMASFTVDRGLYSGDGVYIGCDGLLKLVTGLKQLEFVRIRIEYAPEDLLAALLAAGQAFRRFTLVLEPTTDKCKGQLLEFAVQWKVAQPLLPTVTARVENGT